jgi:hypothetical protein
MMITHVPENANRWFFKTAESGASGSACGRIEMEKEVGKICELR